MHTLIPKVFLLPNEDTYTEFLAVRNTPATPLPLEYMPDFGESTEANTIDWLKSQSMKDRDIYEKSIKAFVSWVRAYKEHQASYIFQIKQVNLGSVARSFGLLKLPKMPELQKGFERRVDFTEANVNVF
jgi:ATP-dependent RNA helicase DDX55/SPB4